MPGDWRGSLRNRVVPASLAYEPDLRKEFPPVEGEGSPAPNILRPGVATVLRERSSYVSEAVSEYDPVQRLSQRESELLLRINRGLAAGMAERYQELMSRRRAGSLAGEELRELLRLTEESERLQAERVEHLTELARLRAKPLGVLIEELGIRPSPNA